MDQDLLIRETATIKEALKALDKTAEKTLFVTDGDRRLLGTITDGDVRRALLAGVGLDDPIGPRYNRSSVYFGLDGFSREEARRVMLARRIVAAPLVDCGGKVCDYVTWDQLAVENETASPKASAAVDVPVVIMAGGKGARLAPFTNVLPKPLIPIGDRTVLEIIMDQFRKYGAHEFLLTVNYRSEMIRAYFEGIEKKEYTVRFYKEADFYGTAGSLVLVKDDLPDTFFVSNCDIIVRADYADVMAFHQANRADLTLIASIRHQIIPYGVVEYGDGGRVTRIVEKPEYSMPISTGVYVLERSCLDLISKGKLFHMTHLIDALLARGGRVFSYFVNEGDYSDTGQWTEYNHTVETMKGRL